MNKLLLALATATSAASLHGMEAPKKSNTLLATIAAYNPINACVRRTPFAWCLLKAAYNTVTGHHAPVWQPELTQLKASTIGTLVHDVTQHKQSEPFLWGVGTSAHQVDGNCSPDSCSWARWEIQQQGKKVKEPAGIACNHWSNYKDDIARTKNSA